MGRIVGPLLLLLLCACQPAEVRPQPEPRTPLVPLESVVRAPGFVKLGPGVRVGLWVENELIVSGQHHRGYLAVVAESAEAWHVEHRDMGLAVMCSSLKAKDDYLYGLVVAKTDGRVLSAVLARPGERGAPIKTNAWHGVPPRQEPTEETEEEVDIALGTFPAKRVSHGDQSQSWLGVGALDGVCLLSLVGGFRIEITALPTEETVPVAGHPIRVQTVAYRTTSDDQWETTYVRTQATADPVLAALQPFGDGRGVVGMESESNPSSRYLQRTLGWGTDAHAQLDGSRPPGSRGAQ